MDDKPYFLENLELLCTSVVHSTGTAENGCSKFHSYPPDNHHCSDVAYWSGGRPSTDKFCHLIYQWTLQFSPKSYKLDPPAAVALFICSQS